MSTNKACGIDNLPSKLLKHSAPVISKPLSFLVNLSLKTGSFPQKWKTAKITPLHKSGDTTNTDNYRPISVLPTLSKILEREIHRQIMTYLETHSLLSRNQFGYRSKRSTQLATTLFLDNIRFEINKGKLVGALFIDLSKAFDTIGHSILLNKLPASGIINKELMWFENYLFNRKHIVQYDETISEPQDIYCGVPQGSILGPLLFMLYFNDIEDVVLHSESIMFADDTVLYASGKNQHELEEKLSKDLHCIYEYLQENDLILNTKKGKLKQ